MSALAASLRLRASSRACDDVDLLAASRHAGFGWLSPDGAGCVGIGVAARVAPEDAVDALAAITHDDDSGTPAAGPRALGALSYDGDTPTGLVLPTWLLARDAEGRGWITHLGTNLDERAEPEPFLTLAPDAPTSTRPSRPHLDVRSRRDRDQWRRAVDRILDAIAAGAIQKLVLAREVDVDADAPFDRHRIVEHLHAEQPTCLSPRPWPVMRRSPIAGRGTLPRPPSARMKSWRTSLSGRPSGHCAERATLPPRQRWRGRRPSAGLRRAGPGGWYQPLTRPGGAETARGRGRCWIKPSAWRPNRRPG